MTKPPTAEEVLGLYQVIYDTGEVCEPFQAFHEAYQQWQAAQGAVTREWFRERFGVCVIICQNGVIYDPRDDGTVVMEVEDLYGQATVDLHNPTRSDIETLVRVLGGESCG